MIESLTDEQVARFPEFVQKWTDIGLCTEPANRPRAEAAIKDIYMAANMPPPKKIVWCGSPLSQGITRAIFLEKKLLSDIGGNIMDSVVVSAWYRIGDSVGADVRDSVWASVGADVRDSVWASVVNSVRASVGDSVGDSVMDSVMDSVRASVGDSVWGSVWGSLGDSIFGQHDAAWLTFYDFFRQVCGLSSQTEKLRGLMALAESAGWAIPHENICWVSERHNLVAKDKNGRLHSMSGPSVAYPDGWAIYAVHGVLVPAFVIECPEKITVSIIEQEKNAEVRRVMVDQYGMERYIKDSGSTLIHSVSECHPIIGLRTANLYRKEMGNDEPIICLDMLNSTPEPDGSTKRYMIRIDPNAYDGLAAKNCLAAMASTYRDSTGEILFNRPEDYCPLAES